ncbi:MAG TPA: putative selenate reductase subunit YgfK [Bacteroidales bacterium]|nr:putative selenate reductase subunit YgfK [Bacteroidales bacterium]HPS17431.1 putative selenate reductase subunit YgfK [Bacteroidales bacterium]
MKEKTNLTDKFSTIPVEQLYSMIENELKSRKEIFGIPQELFFTPSTSDKFRMKRYGQMLESPLGVAAGPHTQMAQNIISAWLCGARYIELKTVQTLDEIHVSKPCIDIQDEGYNCEWSQELKIQEAYDEYLKAWIIIHLLKHHFGWNNDEGLGMIFNMSVGYNMEGILKNNVQWFFNKMADCSKEKNEYVEKLKSIYPEIIKIYIPDKMSDNITLSTMHGCPPDEIEKIGLYLIHEKKLHTTIKLNPTLLGAEALRNILNKSSEFKTEVPDVAFEHDLKYTDALKLIKSLENAAKEEDVCFGLKLTNTLESINNKNIFSKDEKMMYMSGRALHPISINLANKLQKEFKGVLDISFCAGADCFNIENILLSGLKPVTVCSDILKPGGYARLNQYIENIKDISYPQKSASLKTLDKYALQVLDESAYKRETFFTPDIKTNKNLSYFDCVNAPCVGTCPTNQDIPEYLYYASVGDIDKAFEVIMKKNPFPNVLGMVCDHECQTKCTRINYDNSILIRDVKRYIAENASENAIKPLPTNKSKVAVIGAGPSGLACAYFLKLAGFDVDIYETKNIPGGMVADAIPAFRLKHEAIQKDIERIKNLGVAIHYETKIDKNSFEQLRKSHQFIFIATGAQKFKKLGIAGEDCKGIIDPFDFLSSVKRNKAIEFGKNIAIIGGGNTAMDVARTALRIADKDAKVRILYRRTLNEMPAEAEEIKALLDEGIEIVELVAPEKIISDNGKLSSIVCSKMKLVNDEKGGRPKPVKIENSEFEVKVDTLIPALGQDVDIDFVNKKLLQSNSETLETKIENVFIGGDAQNGGKNVIQAIADGRKVAKMIIEKSGMTIDFEPEVSDKKLEYRDYIIKKSKRKKGEIAEETSISQRRNFNLVVNSLSKEQAVKESSRCLYCNDVCSICVTVCPNRANHTYFTKPQTINIYKASKDKDEVIIEKSDILNVRQKYQVINIADFCNECGNCTTFCPTSGAPYRDKPKFYLTAKSFKEVENGFMLSKLKDKTILIQKVNNEISTLTLKDERFIFESEDVKGVFDTNNILVSVEFLNEKIKNIEFSQAANMMVLFNAAEDYFSL